MDSTCILNVNLNTPYIEINSEIYPVFKCPGRRYVLGSRGRWLLIFFPKGSSSVGFVLWSSERRLHQELLTHPLTMARPSVPNVFQTSLTKLTQSSRS